jgi:hypothetical protein
VFEVVGGGGDVTKTIKKNAINKTKSQHNQFDPKRTHMCPKSTMSLS